MTSATGVSKAEGLAPDLEQARQTALVAHGVVIKLKEMGLPQALDEELARLSTDLGDLWSAQNRLAQLVERSLPSATGWEDVGSCLVDLRASLDHMAWHLKSVRRPLTRVTQFVYRKAMESQGARAGK